MAGTFGSRGAAPRWERPLSLSSGPWVPSFDGDVASPGILPHSLRSTAAGDLPWRGRPSAAAARGRRRATPVWIAASATAAAPADTTRLSNIDGVKYSAESPHLATIHASASPPA